MISNKSFPNAEQVRENMSSHKTFRTGILGILLGAAVVLTSLQNAIAQDLPADSAFKVQIEDPNAQTLGLQPEDIYMSYDGLKAVPLLNVGLADAKGAASRDETVKFVTYWNYNHWIDSAEIRIFSDADNASVAPLASVGVNLDGGAQWTVPATDRVEAYRLSLIHI